MAGNSGSVPPAKLRHRFSQAIGPNPKCGAAMHVALEAPSSLATRSQWHLSSTNAPVQPHVVTFHLCLLAEGTHAVIFQSYRPTFLTHQKNTMAFKCSFISQESANCFKEIAQQQALHDLGMKIIEPKMDGSRSLKKV